MNKLRIILQYEFVSIVLLILCILIGLVRCNINFKSKINTNDEVFEGVIISKSFDGDKFSFFLKGKEKIKCTYYLSSLEEKEYYESLNLGSTLKLNGTFNTPNANTIPNNFNYKSYLKMNRVNYTMSVNSIVVKPKKINFLYKIKNIIINRINTSSNKDYLMMFILGDKSLLDSNQYSTYSNLSVTHVFAISGLHISLLSCIMLKLFSFFKNKKYIIVILFLLLYMVLTDFSPSIVRSVTFFIFLYLNKTYDFNLELHVLLYIAISFILIINPFYLYNTGFLYSSIISFSLIRFNKIINGNFIVKMIKISLLSFFVSLPITIQSNYEVNILGFINNLIFVPYISFLLYPLSLLTFIFPFLDNLLHIFIYVLEFLSKFLFVFKIVIPKLSYLYIFIYYLILYIFLRTYNKKYLLLLIISILVYKNIVLLNNNSQVIFYDVGQGDSSLIINNHNLILIDTGGKETYVKEDWMKKKDYFYTDSIIRDIKSLGYSSISSLIISHGDFDHMGEAINLVENLKVEKVIFNCGPYNDLEIELIKVLDRKKIKYYSCIKELNVDKNKLYFLQTKEYDNENDNSNVIITELNGYKFIFMGDASITTEKEILSKYNLPDIDILKVGHHGSKTSSGKEFVDKIKPKYSIISVGENNRYGHPNKEVLDNLKNSKIYRTDQDGSIMFKIKNNRLKIEICSS